LVRATHSLSLFAGVIVYVYDRKFKSPCFQGCFQIL
jgi:hypothetical protein